MVQALESNRTNKIHVLSYKTNHSCRANSIEISTREIEGFKAAPGNTKGGSITVPLTSCLTGLD